METLATVNFMDKRENDRRMETILAARRHTLAQSRNKQ